MRYLVEFEHSVDEGFGSLSMDVPLERGIL